jgi:7-carboxy-7-deazaguanine synthase
LFLQPEWSKREEQMGAIVEYIKLNPRWRVSLQTHKYLNIP